MAQAGPLRRRHDVAEQSLGSLEPALEEVPHRDPIGDGRPLFAQVLGEDIFFLPGASVEKKGPMVVLVTIRANDRLRVAVGVGRDRREIANPGGEQCFGL